MPRVGIAVLPLGECRIISSRAVQQQLQYVRLGGVVAL